MVVKLNVVKIYEFTNSLMEGKIGSSLSKIGRKVWSLWGMRNYIKGMRFSDLSHESAHPNLTSSVYERLAILEIDIKAIEEIGI